LQLRGVVVVVVVIVDVSVSAAVVVRVIVLYLLRLVSVHDSVPPAEAVRLGAPTAGAVADRASSALTFGANRALGCHLRGESGDHPSRPELQLLHRPPGLCALRTRWLRGPRRLPARSWLRLLLRRRRGQRWLRLGLRGPGGSGLRDSSPVVVIVLAIATSAVVVFVPTAVTDHVPPAEAMRLGALTTGAQAYG
jgi:hypothetical protein